MYKVCSLCIFHKFGPKYQNNKVYTRSFLVLPAPRALLSYCRWPRGISQFCFLRHLYIWTESPGWPCKRLCHSRVPSVNPRPEGHSQHSVHHAQLIVIHSHANAIRWAEPRRTISAQIDVQVVLTLYPGVSNLPIAYPPGSSVTKIMPEIRE